VIGTVKGDNMLKRGLVAAALVALTLAVPTEAADRGLYVGASIGGSSIDIRDFDEELGNLRFSDGDTAYKIFAGYRFLSVLAVEAGYVDLGTPSDTIDNGDTNVEIGVQGWDALAVGILPLGPVDVFGKLGIVSWNADITAAVEDVSRSDNGTDLTYGVGVALRLSSIAVRVETERFEIDNAESVYLFSAGVTFTF
jgi:hypothetical protein